jgi:hypothetical protein
MRVPYRVQSGIPLPPKSWGRKKGSVDRNHAARQDAINQGVRLVASGLNYIEAAKSALATYPVITKERMARLISQSIKDSHET